MTKSEKERLDELEKKFVRYVLNDIPSRSRLEVDVDWLLKDVKQLKEWQSKKDVQEYWAAYKASHPPIKDKPSSAMMEAYWLNCFAWGLIGMAVTLAALRFGGVI